VNTFSRSALFFDGHEVLILSEIIFFGIFNSIQLTSNNQCCLHKLNANVKNTFTKFVRLTKNFFVLFDTNQEYKIITE
jgi:hypothetical protein